MKPNSTSFQVERTCKSQNLQAQRTCKQSLTLHGFITKSEKRALVIRAPRHLLVERLGVGGGGSDVGIAGSLVGASLLLELLGSLQVSCASRLVGSLVLAGLADEVGDGGFENSEHVLWLW